MAGRFDIVFAADESRAWGDVDHIASAKKDLTLCGKPVGKRTRRESLRETAERTPCYECSVKARQAVIDSFDAAQELTRVAGQDWGELLRRAGVR